MANDVTSKVILGLDPSEFRRGIQQVDAKLKETSKLLGNLGQLIGASFAVSHLQAFTSEAIQLGSQLETVSKGFARFGDPAQLAQLRKATRGLVTDLDLMKATVMAGNFGIPIEQLGGLLEFAKRRAQETGQSVDYLVESIVVGIGRKSPLILDNLGISTTRLKEKFNGAALEAQNIADVARAVGDIAKEELGKMGTAVDTAADKMVRLSTNWQNFKAAFGQAVAPAAASVLQFLTDQLTQAQIKFQLLKRELTEAKPSDKIRKQPTAGGGAAPAVTETVRSLESLRNKLKELQAEYEGTEIGTRRFYELRTEIEKVNYQLGRASGEIWSGAKDGLIDLQAKGLTPLNHSLTQQDMILRTSVIPIYDEWGKMIQGAKDQLAAMDAQLRMASAVGAEFGLILSQAFSASIINGEDFFATLKKAIMEYVKQMAVALATTTALAGIFSAVTGGGFAAAFGAISQGTGLGNLFGEGGILQIVGRLSGTDIQLSNSRTNTFLRGTN
jgi:hypothetical protein